MAPEGVKIIMMPFHITADIYYICIRIYIYIAEATRVTQEVADNHDT